MSTSFMSNQFEDCWSKTILSVELECHFNVLVMRITCCNAFTEKLPTKWMQQAQISQTCCNQILSFLGVFQKTQLCVSFPCYNFLTLEIHQPLNWLRFGLPFLSAMMCFLFVRLECNRHQNVFRCRHLPWQWLIVQKLWHELQFLLWISI